MQLTISEFWSSIKDCLSQASFKDFIIRSLGPKNYCNDQNFQTAVRNRLSLSSPRIPIDLDK